MTISFPNKILTLRKHLPIFIISISIAAIFITVLKKAWIGEDTYITFRTVDNFVNGYGLRYNIDERVQTYTHPLWLMLHIPLYWLTKNIYFTSIFLSLLCSTGACLANLIALQKKVNIFTLCFTFTLPILFSRSFDIYATSGFEIPLTLLLFSLFSMAISTKMETNWFLLSFIIALNALNRLDTILLFIPIFIALLVYHRKNISWKKIIAGFSPIILWELFSLFYYGFLFPNTKYAKLDTGLPRMTYIHKGWLYVRDLLGKDLLSGFIILFSFGLLIYLLYAKDGLWKDSYKNRLLLLGIGILLYCLYVVYIGGDYVSFRMWLVPFFGALTCCNYFLYIANENTRRRIAVFFGAVFMIVYAIQTIHIPHTHKGMTFGPVVDHWNKTNSIDYALDMILHNKARSYWPNWVDKGLQYSELTKKGDHLIFREVGGVGLLGFHAGPRVILSDRHALVDPLRARLPTFKKRGRVAHFERHLPPGYIQARMYNDYQFMDPDLAVYYKKLRRIICDPLFSGKRIWTILLFNMGAYDQYKDKYIARHLSKDLNGSADPS